MAEKTAALLKSGCGCRIGLLVLWVYNKGKEDATQGDDLH